VHERRCSFCTRPVDDRDSYVAGAEALICAECVRAAVRLIGDDEDAGATAPTVDGPVPDEAAAGEVAHAFVTVFDPAVPDAERAVRLEDGDVLAPLLAWAHEPAPGAGGATVERIRFLDRDRALVRGTVHVGTGAPVPLSGWVRRHPSGWLVARATYTTLLQLSGIPPL
jgi:hypothetical protein